MEIKDKKLIISKDELAKLLSKEYRCEASMSGTKCMYGKSNGETMSFENCIVYQLISLFNPNIQAWGRQTKQYVDACIEKDPSDPEVYHICPVYVAKGDRMEYPLEPIFSKLEIEIKKD